MWRFKDENFPLCNLDIDERDKNVVAVSFKSLFYDKKFKKKIQLMKMVFINCKTEMTSFSPISGMSE
jgi:hypothetical protein